MFGISFEGSHPVCCNSAYWAHAVPTSRYQTHSEIHVASPVSKDRSNVFEGQNPSLWHVGTEEEHCMA